MRLYELIREFQDYSVTDGDSADELIIAVRDLLTMMMAEDSDKISTEEFNDRLKKQGFNISIDELIAVVDQSGYASSVNQDEIVPASELDPNLVPGEDELPDVGDMASSQAMDNIEDEL